MPTSSNSNPNALDTRWPRWLRRGPLEMLATLIIGLGLFMLLQPIALVFYT